MPEALNQLAELVVPAEPAEWVAVVEWVLVQALEPVAGNMAAVDVVLHQVPELRFASQSDATGWCNPSIAGRCGPCGLAVAGRLLDIRWHAVADLRSAAA